MLSQGNDFIHEVQLPQVYEEPCWQLQRSLRELVTVNDLLLNIPDCISLRHRPNVHFKTIFRGSGLF